MVQRRTKSASETTEYEPPIPAKTVEGREDQMITYATNLAEKRILTEVASAQEVVHYLKLGTVRNRLEQEKIESENALLKSRVKELESRGSSDELLKRAIRAFGTYSGEEVDDEDQDI